MLISNHNSWRDATDAQRMEEIERLISKGLRKLFDFQDIKHFECAGLTNPVARFEHRQTGMIMHLIPGSDDFKLGIAPEFYAIAKKNGWMDLDENDFEQRFPHSVAPFLIGEFVITEAEWKTMAGSPLFKQYGDDHGIDAVSRKNIREAATTVGLRLPSEIEWEYVCKAGTNSLFYWGNEPNDEYAWTSNSKPFPTGDYKTLSFDQQKKKNAFGLLGMIGNLAEWVEDDAHLYSSRQADSKPYYSYAENADGILRGGWITYDWKFNRSTSRISCSIADRGCSARLAMGLADLIGN